MLNGGHLRTVACMSPAQAEPAALAGRHHADPRVPLTLIVVAGHAGVGKTTIAEAVCRTHRWALLDKDTVAGPLVDTWMAAFADDPNDRSAPAYRTIRPAEYTALLNTAVHVLLAGGPTVCVVAPFAEDGDLDAVEFLAETHDYNLAGIWVTCPPDDHRARLLGRGSPRDRDKLTRLHEWVDERRDPPLLPAWMRTFDNARETSRQALADRAYSALQLAS